MQLIPLNDLCTDVIDCPHETPEWKTSGIRVVRNYNLTNGRVNNESPSYVDEATYIKRTRRAKPETGDLIISREAPMGPVAIVPDYKCCLGQRLVLLKPDKAKCDNRYLLYALMSDFVQKQIRRADTTGSIVSNLNIPDLKALMIPCPPMKEQRAVAGCLDAIFEKIENNNAIISELESMAKDIYDYWFVQFDFPDDNGKPYKSSGGKMVWNEELKREIPEGWAVSTYGKCISSINTGLNPRDNFKLNTGGKIKYLTVKNLTTKGTVDFSSCDMIDESARAIVHKRSDIKIGDVLFASISPLGRCFIITEDPVDWDINESVFSIRPNDANMTSSFLYMSFTSDLFVKMAEGSSVGSVFKGIRISELQGLEMVLPPKQILDSFNNVVMKLFEMKANAFKENRELESFRDWLLPMLMNGQVKVGGAV